MRFIPCYVSPKTIIDPPFNNGYIRVMRTFLAMSAYMTLALGQLRIKRDSSMKITLLHQLIVHWEHELPFRLYDELDAHKWEMHRHSNIHVTYTDNFINCCMHLEMHQSFCLPSTLPKSTKLLDISLFIWMSFSLHGFFPFLPFFPNVHDHANDVIT